MLYRSNNPEISQFASSNHMQGFRYEEESHSYAPQQIYSAPTHIPQHQDMLPMELNGPPFGQPTSSTQLTLLGLEFTWSDEDDPIRLVILEEMKKIKSGKELVEEVRKIEKNINAINTISSLPELSVAGISLEVCEVPTPSHSAEQDSESPEEEIRQIQEEILEAKAQDDPELEQQSDQVEDPSSITLEEAKEVDVIEDEEPETHLPIIIQERDLAGFCLCAIHYMLTRFEVTFLGTLVDSEHGDEEKQGGTHKEGRSWSRHEDREAKGEELQLVR
ncbi:hypothetical protein VPH35_090150 [Triticum aestivum]